MSGVDGRLCYLPAANVSGPTGQLASMAVRGRSGNFLGTVDGVLIEPERRRLRFLVVRTATSPARVHVVPIDAAARLQRADGTLAVEADDLAGWALFDRRLVDDFTEEDAVAPTFHKYLDGAAPAAGGRPHRASGHRGLSAPAPSYLQQLRTSSKPSGTGLPSLRRSSQLIHNQETPAGRRGGCVKLEGVYSVLPTPFTRDGEVDEASLRRVIELFVGAGISGVTALGVTGEVARLDDTERERVLAITIDQVAGRVGVVAGTSADGTRTCIAYSRRAREAGATAVMVSPPRLPKLNSEAVVRHYSALADAVDIEIVVQDYPPISGYAMEPSLLGRIARDIPAARTIKLEDPPTPFKTSRILEQTPGMDVRVFGGLGGVFLLEELMAGATGAMTGFAFPELLVQIVRLYRGGEIDRAAEVFYRAVPLMRFEFQEGIGMAIRKEVLRRRGALETGATRAPAAGLDAVTTAALDRVLAFSESLIGAGRPA